MADDRFIEIEVKNEHEILRDLERLEERNHRKARELIDELSKFTEDMLAIMVPKKSLYIFKHIDRSGPAWMPGGPGGGGEWKSIVGIKHGGSLHPLYAEFGTGLYAGRKLITARHDRAKATVVATRRPRLSKRQGGVLTFQKGTEPRAFRMWVQGQPAQRYFYLTWATLHTLARERVIETRLFD